MTNLTIKQASRLLILAALFSNAACTTPDRAETGRVNGPYVGTGGGYNLH